MLELTVLLEAIYWQFKAHKLDLLLFATNKGTWNKNCVTDLHHMIAAGKAASRVSFDCTSSYAQRQAASSSVLSTDYTAVGCF
jgi:hypothetical protein